VKPEEAAAEEEAEDIKRKRILGNIKAGFF